MDVKEKLMEIVKKAAYSSLPSNTEDFHLNMFVMNLLAHGVTVQEWVSVDDRLPEDDEVVIIFTDKNFVYAGELIGDTWFLDNDNWTETVTHWMPMPDPPKGE